MNRTDVVVLPEDWRPCQLAHAGPHTPGSCPAVSVSPSPSELQAAPKLGDAAMVDTQIPTIALHAVMVLCDSAAPGISTGPVDCTGHCSYGPCDCSGIRKPLAWDLDPDRVRQVVAHSLGVTGEDGT